MTLEELKIEVNKQGIKLSDSQILSLDKFLDLVLEKNKVMNLTAIKEKSEAIEKHLYDCLLVLKTNLIKEGCKVCDIGSGAGFPGIVLAIACPNSEFTLVEPLHKRANFLNEVVTSLNLKNVAVKAERSEDIKNERESFDIVTSRAVARLNVLLEIGAHLVKVGGNFIAMKAKSANEEIDEAKHAIKELNLRLDQNFNDFLPSSKEERNNIVFVKHSKLLLKYPRKYSNIVKKPL